MNQSIPSSYPVRIGFVGVGNMGQMAHLKNYAILPECTITAVCDPNLEKAQAVAARYAIPAVYSSAQEMLQSNPPDGIVASQPFSRHGQIVPELIASGIPIFIEKPIARSLPIAQDLLEQSRRHHTSIMVGYHKRCDPATALALSTIHDWRTHNKAGRLQYIRISMPVGNWTVNGFRGLIQTDNQNMPPMQLDNPQPGFDGKDNPYDHFINYYVHQINLLRHLVGESYSISYADPSQILLVGHTASGIPLLLEMNPYRTSIDWQESALICFEKGWIRLDLPAPLASFRCGSVSIFNDFDSPPSLTQPQLPWEHAMLCQARRFLQVVRKESPPPCGAEEACEDLQICLQAVQAMQAAKGTLCR